MARKQIKKPVRKTTKAQDAKIESFISNGHGSDNSQLATSVSALDARVSLRISKEARTSFRIACLKNSVSMESELRGFIHKRTRELTR